MECYSLHSAQDVENVYGWSIDPFHVMSILALICTKGIQLTLNKTKMSLAMYSLHGE